MNLQNKFQCQYRLLLDYIAKDNETRQSVVTSPITIHFNVKKELFKSINSGRIEIYNLDLETQTYIYQDKLLLEQGTDKKVELMAGYGNTLTTCLQGRIQECYSERVGTDMVTTIDVIDTDILNQHASVTFEAGTTRQEAINYLYSQMPNLKVGETGQFGGIFNTPTTFSGNAFYVINQVTGGHTFIDNGVINSLNDNEVLSNYGVYLIQSDTGLLGTPKRREAVLEVEMLFEPTIRMGQLVEIKSETQSQFNGQFKVVGIEHDCVISGSTGGKRTTKLQLLYIEFLTNSNVNVTGNPQGSSPSYIINNKATPLNSKITSSVENAYKYIKNNSGAVPPGKAGNIITWADMVGHGNSPNERYTEITKGDLANCAAIAQRVENFIYSYFRGKSFKVSSGWRSKENNARENGASRSQHLVGRAIDLVVNGVSANKVYATAANSNMFNYVGSYSGHTHVDVRS